MRQSHCRPHDLDGDGAGARWPVAQLRDDKRRGNTYRIMLLTLQLSFSYARSSSVSPIFLLLSPGTQIRMLPSAARQRRRVSGSSREGRVTGTDRRRQRRAPRLRKEGEGRSAVVGRGLSSQARPFCGQDNRNDALARARLTKRREPNAVDDPGVLAQRREVLDLGLRVVLLRRRCGRGRLGLRRGRGGRRAGLGGLGGEREGGSAEVGAGGDEPELCASRGGCVSGAGASKRQDCGDERCAPGATPPSRAPSPHLARGG